MPGFSFVDAAFELSMCVVGGVGHVRLRQSPSPPPPRAGANSTTADTKDASVHDRS